MHKNEDDLIYSYFEFDIVDKNGKQINDGEYMYVRDIWVHTTYNGKKEISKFIKEAEESPLTKKVKYIYWLRTKWVLGKKISQRLSKTFKRNVCLNHKEKKCTS